MSIHQIEIGTIVRHHDRAGLIVGICNREMGNGLGPGDFVRWQVAIVQEGRILKNGTFKPYKCPTATWDGWTVAKGMVASAKSLPS